MGALPFYIKGYEKREAMTVLTYTEIKFFWKYKQQGLAVS